MVWFAVDFRFVAFNLCRLVGCFVAGFVGVFGCLIYFMVVNSVDCI